jgi:hypothetical protein
MVQRRESPEEAVARAFHEAYERLAPRHGYETREASAKPWAEVPEPNRRLMVSVVTELVKREIIYPHPGLGLDVVVKED